MRNLHLLFIFVFLWWVTPNSRFASDAVLAQNSPQQSRPSLRSGSKGNEVSELQAALKLLGYFTGKVDGVYSENTAIAVSRFQQAAGLKSDGVVGAETWNRLFPATLTTATPAPSTSSTTNSAASFPVPSTTVTTSESPQPTTAASPNPQPTTAASPSLRPTTPPISKTSNRQTTTSPISRTSNRQTTTSPISRTSNRQTTTSSNSSYSRRETTPSNSGYNRRETTPSNPGYNRRETTPSNSRTYNRQPSSGNDQSSQNELPTLRLGAQGPSVTRLQRRLRNLGFYKGTVNGVYDPPTQSAVQAAQQRYKLEADGVVGPSTWNTLLR